MVTCKFIPAFKPMEKNRTKTAAKFLIYYDKQNEDDQKKFGRLEKFVDDKQKIFKISLVKTKDHATLICHDAKQVKTVQKKLVGLGVTLKELISYTFTPKGGQAKHAKFKITFDPADTADHEKLDAFEASIEAYFPFVSISGGGNVRTVTCPYDQHIATVKGLLAKAKIPLKK